MEPSVISPETRRRFFASIDTASSEIGCHLWTLGLSSRGYGNFSIKNRTYSAHRMAYHFAFGPIPCGLFVLHKCDNRKCVNPQHIFLGTHADNMRDMCQKERGALCRRNNLKAKISKSIAEIIVDRYSTGTISQVQLAAKYGVSQSAISYIIVGGRPRSLPKLQSIA